MALPKKRWITLGLLVLLLGVAAGAFGPIVRSRVQKTASARHLDVVVGGVRPGFFKVGLRDVHVRPEGVEGIEVVLHEVDVTLSAGLAPRGVIVRGGEIALHGDPTELRDKLRALRKEKDGEPAAPSTASSLEVQAEDLSVKLTTDASTTAQADGVRVTKNDSGTTISVQSAKISDPALALALGAVEVQLDAEGNLARASADSANVSLLQRPKELSPAGAAGTEDPAPPPLPPPQIVATKPGRGVRAPKPKKGEPAVVAASATSRSDAPLFPLPDPRALRAKLALIRKEALPRIPKESAFSIDKLTLTLPTAEGDVTLGPGPLTVKREGDTVRVAFSSDVKDASPQKSPPLSIEAEVPITQGDTTIALSGGPVSLARLGLKDGAGGLLHTGEATLEGRGRVVLTDDGSTLTFDVDVRGRKIALNQPRLTPETIENLNVAVSARGVLGSDGLLRIDDAQASLGETKLELRGSVEQKPDHAAMAMTFTVPIASCQAMVDTAPAALLPLVRNARFSGTFSASGRIQFDTRKLDDLLLDYQIADRCRIMEVPRELARERFTHAFTHNVVLPDGKIAEETTGPGTESWTDIDKISPFMTVAVLTTEDGGFYRHHGFNHPAFRNSLVANLKAARFVRGASTISMQLTKNLFLSRTKSISRKLEEVILTDYLEQVFSKDELMELYLNVIEFGPDIYGITKAADTYFGRKPEELTLAECLYLSSVLPSPIRYFHMKEKGEAPEYWMKHIYSLMQIASKTGRVSKKELEIGLGEHVEFWKNGGPRPVPRMPQSGPRMEGEPEPAEDWKPVD